MTTPIARRALLAALPAALAAPALPRAQQLTRDVRWIVGFAAGGSVDAMARIVAAAIGPQIGRNVVVENRTGAGGFIGLQAVANSPPDGHVLAIASGFNLSVSPVLPGMTMPIDPDAELVPIGGMGRGAMVLVARPDAPFRTMADFIAHAKRPGARITCGHGGAGSSPHLMAARMAQLAGIELDFIAYRGGAPALVDLMAGRIDVYFALLPEALQHVRGGAMRGLAVATAAPHPTLPDVPVMQATLPGMVGGSWWGVAGPKGLSPEWVAWWSNQIGQCVRRPEVRARLTESLIDESDTSTAAFREEIARERRIWAEVIRTAGIRVSE
ncbi:Bug family tripartite tricarboxylate transporter substrate binding protein [Falsiroseomonas sp. CW058]|uniref:Bug family tripartite tricarboxylate transporter substrate binding protein n=1 Tax=Falsiroseomonas sp. CW058 TaxID=3388664 RepID=UPI003D323729